MSHVDEGQLHAYLDGALGSETARSRVEDHLRLCADCRSRLDTARRDREEAGGILALLDPGEVRVPAPEELRGSSGPGGGRPGRAGRRRSAPSAAVRLAWAASVLLALGGGWMLRSAMIPGVMPGSVPGEAGPQSTVATSMSPASTRGEAEAQPGVDAAERATAPGAAAREVAAREVAVREPAPPEPAPPEPAPPEAAPREAAPREASAPMPPAETEVGPPAGPPSRADRELAVDAVAGDLELEEGAGWIAMSPAEAAELLGRPPLDLEGLPWERFEALQADGHVLVRSLHPLEDGVRIEFLQGRRQDEGQSFAAGAAGAAGAARAGTVQARSAEPRPALALSARDRTRAEAGFPAPFPPTVDIPEGHAEVRSEHQGISFLLRGPVDPALLERLAERVR